VRTFMSLRIFPDRSEQPRVGTWIFVLAWFVGNLALIAGFEAAQGLLQELLVLGVLGIAFGAWWGAYRMSNYHSRGGFVVIALWALSLIVPLLDFAHYIRDVFFWGSAVMLMLLLAASFLPLFRQRQRNPEASSSTPPTVTTR
jgi:hypothetical protein